MRALCVCFVIAIAGCTVGDLDESGKACSGATCPGGLPCIDGICGGADAGGGDARVDGEGTDTTSQAPLQCPPVFCGADAVACCYSDPTSADGTCVANVATSSCNPSYVFHCTSSADCTGGRVCCSISAYIVLAGGGDYNALQGAQCTDATTCANAADAHVLCSVATSPDGCPSGKTCQPWGTVAGGRYPNGFSECL